MSHDLRPSSFDEAVVALRPRLFAFAMSLCRDPSRAEDLAQHVIARALEKWDSFQEGTNLGGWLFTILRNEHYSQGRKAHREVEDADGIIAGKVAIGEGQTSALDLKNVRKRMRLMSKEMREAIELVGMEQMQYDEAAEILGVPSGTIKSRVSRARDFLDTGDEGLLAAELETEMAEETGTTGEVNQVATLFESGLEISEIAKATGMKRSDVMRVVAEQRLRRSA